MIRERLISSPIFDDDTKYPPIFYESEIVAFSEMNEKFVFEKITILAERDGGVASNQTHHKEFSKWVVIE